MTEENNNKINGNTLINGQLTIPNKIITDELQVNKQFNKVEILILLEIRICMAIVI